MKSYIELEKMRFYAYHGVSETERKVGNYYEVDIQVCLDLEAAMRTDDLSTTLDYGLLYEWVRQEMTVPSKLLEHVAGRIRKTVQTRCPAITGGTVRVSKIKPPICGDIERASVTVQW
ncbi:MAG: dihydroneopterin aldolase [Coprobacter sp.]|nr:dihydroneopterin aldolase [Coprobacter sp.]